uniref:Regulatory protein zeste n=1 Tax=Diabrotica virgifera virgifera TaxID=50390 RepID=A0A6P7H8F7_DIAVI
MASGTPKKKASSDQLNFLVDFIAGNKILLHGKTKSSEADNNTVDKLWDELTLSLNATGSGPQKFKAQWKKTFIDWKSHTKKKARECVRSEQRTGGGKGDGKALTPIEEKLMGLLSWTAVKGADVHEIGFEHVNAEPQLYNDVITEVHMDDSYLDEPEETVEITVLPGSSTLKRPAESRPYVEPKRKATTAK